MYEILIELSETGGKKKRSHPFVSENVLADTVVKSFPSSAPPALGVAGSPAPPQQPLVRRRQCNLAG